MKIFKIFFCFIVFFAILKCINNETQYYTSGQIKSKINKEGNRTCIEDYYKNGTLKGSYCTLNGVLEGEMVSFFENSKLKSKCTFDNGNIIDTLFEYYSSGEIYKIAVYDKGKLNDKVFFYYKDGSLKATNFFKNDSLYFVENILFESKDTVHKILPIIHIDSTKVPFQINDTINIKVEIPMQKDFYYDDSDLNIYYDFVLYDSTKIYDLPSEFIRINKNNESFTLKLIPMKAGNYRFMGLIFINEETPDPNNNHYFYREILVQ